MTNRKHILTPREASRMLGISYPTIKNWILSGKLKTSKTPGGHHRVPYGSLKPFLGRDAFEPDRESCVRYWRVGGRNQLAGIIVSVRIMGIMAEVILAMGNTNVTAIIAAEAMREMALKKGDSAAALISPTNVMIELLNDYKA